MLNAGTGSVENVLNILQRLCSLLSSGLARQFAGGRINAQLAGYEHEAIGLHRLTVCAQRGRRLGSGYGFHLFAHIVLLLILGAPTCCGRRRYTSPPATTNRTISNDWQCRLRSSLLSKVAFSAHDARHTAINRLFLAIPDDSRRFQTIRLPFSPNRTVFPRPKRAGITGLAIADTSTSLARAEYAKGFRRLAESHAGGLDGDRTHDLLFRRQTLYPLSYKPE